MKKENLLLFKQNALPIFIGMVILGILSAVYLARASSIEASANNPDTTTNLPAATVDTTSTPAVNPTPVSSSSVQPTSSPTLSQSFETEAEDRF